MSCVATKHTKNRSGVNKHFVHLKIQLPLKATKIDESIFDYFYFAEDFI